MGAKYISLSYNSRIASIGGSVKYFGRPVRCVHGGDYLPEVSTAAVSNVTGSSAFCGGTVINTGSYPVTVRGICWSTSPNPTVSDSHTNDGEGTGTFTSTLTGLISNTTYYVRAYATNSVGTAYGNTEVFTSSSIPIDGQPCPNAFTVTDYDGNSYNTVQIGNQCWMKENLRTTHYSDGSTVSYYNSSDTTLNGRLYTWFVVMNGSSSSTTNPSGVQGICPQGWHVPSDEEWTQLTNYVKNQSQNVCGTGTITPYIAKSLASNSGWNTSVNICDVGRNQEENNATGFSARAAGFYYNNYNYGNGDVVYYWSSTEYGVNYAWIRRLDYNMPTVDQNGMKMSGGGSVRCVKNLDKSSNLI